MSLRGHAVLCVTLLAILGVPRAGHAGLADLIWEMSGPQLIGFGLECKVWFAQERPDCRLFEIPLSENEQDERRLWLSFDMRGYGSTGKDSEDVRFGIGRIRMVGFDPMLGFKSRPGGRVYHGVGGSFNWFFGPDFPAFANQALKLRPIAVQFTFLRIPWDVAYNLRLYPNGFDADPSTPDQLLAEGEAFERVHGVTVGVRW